MLYLGEIPMVGERSRTMKLEIAESVKKSADDLIELGLTDSDPSLLEKVIQTWIEEFIDDLPDNIEYYRQYDNRLQKLIFEAEYQTEQLALPVAS